MKYEIRRPSGHVLKKGECADFDSLNAIYDKTLRSRRGYIEVFVGEIPAIGGGTSTTRVFESDYHMRRGVIKAGAIAQVLSVTKTDVHVDLYAENAGSCERYTFPRKDFMETTCRTY